MNQERKRKSEGKIRFQDLYTIIGFRHGRMPWYESNRFTQIFQIEIIW